MVQKIIAINVPIKIYTKITRIGTQNYTKLYQLKLYQLKN